MRTARLAAAIKRDSARGGVGMAEAQEAVAGELVHILVRGSLETQPMVELGAARIAVVHGQPEMSVATGLPAPGDLAQQPFADARARRAAAT